MQDDLDRVARAGASETIFARPGVIITRADCFHAIIAAGRDPVVAGAFAFGPGHPARGPVTPDAAAQVRAAFTPPPAQPDGPPGAVDAI